jgi:hypothetical protein
MRRALTSFIGTVGVAGLLSAGTLTIAAPSAASAAETCPNQAFRTGFSAALPDCRAYELVSPPGIQPYFETFTGAGGIENVAFGAAILGAALDTTAAPSSTDSGIAFFSTFAPAGSTTDGPDYLSTRGPAGWTTKNLIPPQSTEVTAGCLPFTIGWSTDMGRTVLSDGWTEEANTCGADEPELVPGEPRGAQNLFLQDNTTDSYQLIDQAPLTGGPASAVFQAGSDDLGLVAFSEPAQLTPEAPAATNDYYVWAGGSVDRLLTILPNGQPAVGRIVNAAEHGTLTLASPTFTHAVAPDGSRIEFTSSGNLYSRLNPADAQSAFNEAGECDEPSKACTVQIDSSETAESGGGGLFAGGSGGDGRIVYFIDANRLTSDSTAAAGEPDLYEYDFRKPAGERLTDLTVDQNTGEQADVLGFVGSNETGPEGDYVYFVASGVLASNENHAGAVASSGSPNLYVMHEGTLSFIATLSLASDSCDWEIKCMTARVSPNGRYLGFDSLEELTGFANADANTGQPDQEIFLYDAAEGLRCASCSPAGAAPIAPASIRLPVGVSVPNVPTPLSLQRNVSDNGQVFFDTQNPLVAGARNGQSNLFAESNVYEYEGGQLHLLSSGTAESSSFFYEASADGGDVYLITAQGLASGGSSTEVAIYDAKVDGGFPTPPAASEPCSGEACSAPRSIAPRLPVISSAAVSGSGNLELSVSKSPAAVRSLTGAQKLAKALKACRAKRNKHKRGVCEARARKRYGPHVKKSAKTINRRGK